MMNSRQKLVLIIAVVLIVLVFVIWLAGGAEVFTKTRVWVDNTSELDRMLGIEVGEWQDKFIFGLVPPGLTATFEMVSTSTLAGLILLVTGVLFFKLRIKKQKETL
jgi:hypothetical protein